MAVDDPSLPSNKGERIEVRDSELKVAMPTLTLSLEKGEATQLPIADVD